MSNTEYTLVFGLGPKADGTPNTDGWSTPTGCLVLPGGRNSDVRLIKEGSARADAPSLESTIRRNGVRLSTTYLGLMF